MTEGGKFRFAIDRGGTFTDIWAKCPDDEIIVMKLLSVDPANYEDAPREGIRRIMEKKTGRLMPATEPVDTSNIEWIRMGTTVATNSLLERTGERMALVVTKGFRDILHIGNQSRPDIFDLEIVTPEQLYERVVEVDERLVLHQDRCDVNYPYHSLIKGTTNEKLEVWKRVDEDQLRKDLQTVLDEGIKSLAVALMHSYICAKHERKVGQIAKEMGFTHVSLSSEMMEMQRIVPRGFTACADAYLTPCIQKYVKGFSSGFKGGLNNTNVLFMRSDGGLTPVDRFNGFRAILSGPAGGVVGYALTTYNQQTKQPVIGFDMGGTSTDVSRYAGQYEQVLETTTAGVTIQATQLDINTVAAGGGSQLFFRSGLFVVGPESAGAHPGPVCYKKGGPLTITDANLYLGRILPEYFPAIFGEKENEPLDKVATTAAFEKLTSEVNAFLSIQPSPKTMTVEEVAMGFIEVANESMCRPIRALSQAKGHDTSRHVLACFGGAGGQHACAIARSLGMSQVFVHRYAGILSAYGMALADVVHEEQKPCSKEYIDENFPYIDERVDVLTKNCIAELQREGFSVDNIETEVFLNLRYDRTDCALMINPGIHLPSTSTSRHGDFKGSFIERYKTEFGFILENRKIMVDDVKVRGVGKSAVASDQTIPSQTTPPVVDKVVKCYFETGFMDTSVYLLQNLLSGHSIKGPAIIIDKNSTILVEPTCTASISSTGDIHIVIGSGVAKTVGTELDAIQLSIFSHRFMSIAEQMGRVLQRTSISTNIKERLDFSCALFGDDGGLVANAPHIPVHLGAMQETVQYQMRSLGDDLHDGDVVLSNHPQAGGSHLPDLTVITPVFYKGEKKPVFYVASRGHHADIGGITPGSMPPHSRNIHEEGAVFKTFKLVNRGEFMEKELIEAFNEPAKYPGSSGSRNINDNLSDLRAQIAANHKGIQLVSDLIDEYGLDVVKAYMAYIQRNAEIAVRDMLKEIAKRTKERTGHTKLYAEDYMDNGSKIALDVEIDEKEGTATFDFSKTGYEVHGNSNAPRAVTLSGLIYCLRCMVGHNVPLNQGCLKPVKVIIPKGSLLDPSEDAAVVGGNVTTSQRIVDVVLKAFGVCAASQGCMNNVTFGDKDVGYYETVAGGAGAGPTWDGRSGVHSHMTNTRITDPEIVEKRYPVVVKCFHLNPNTGGQGEYTGGDGVVRELLFRRAFTLSVLTERRVFRPYGLNGGEDGKHGVNLMYYKDGRIVNLGGKNCADVNAGDIFHMETPGGGGFGLAEGKEPKKKRRRTAKNQPHGTGSLFTYKRNQESC